MPLQKHKDQVGMEWLVFAAMAAGLWAALYLLYLFFQRKGRV